MTDPAASEPGAVPSLSPTESQRPAGSGPGASSAAALHDAVRRKAAELGALVVRMTALAEAGHPSSALSLAHLVTCLMYRQMRYDPADPWHPSGDRLVLSEGHAVPIVYAAYADLGGAVGTDPEHARPLRIEDLDTLRARRSVLDGHPNPAEGFPFFDAATGSLGQGLSVAAGLALAARLDRSGRRVYVLIGDGESREGQIAEALDFISDYKLRNVCAIFNANGQGQAGLVSSQQSPARLAAKLRAYGWQVASVDGHDPAAILAALRKSERARRPLAIVARTIKGWGVPALQAGNWHGKPLKAEDLAAAQGALQASLPGSAAALGRPPRPVEPQARRVAPPSKAAKAAGSRSRPDPREVTWPGFEETMQAGGSADALARNSLSTRRAYGATLKVAGDLLPQVVVLDGDVSNSTFANVFAQAHPERFFECKIAEQNMVSVAVGLSAAGYIPFANSFAKFLARAYDQVELAGISRANIKLVGSHAGITPCSDGPSQMALPDVAYFRALAGVRADDRVSPLCWCYQPADAVAAYHCTRLMLAHRGMCYMRTHRPDVPRIYDPQMRFEPGGLHVLSAGDDLALVTAGYLVQVGQAAVALLAQQNIRATLVDAYSLPLQAGRLAEVLQRAGRRALVFEDNYAGGLGAAVAEVAARTGGVQVAALCCERIPKSTRTIAEILDYCGVSAAQVADHALALLRESPVP